jgi:hypothetical protein
MLFKAKSCLRRSQVQTSLLLFLLCHWNCRQNASLLIQVIDLPFFFHMITYSCERPYEKRASVAHQFLFMFVSEKFLPEKIYSFNQMTKWWYA